MSQRLPVNNVQWLEQTSQFNEDFVKNNNEESDKGYFLEVDVQYPKNWMNYITIYFFLPERKKSKKAKKLVTNLYYKNLYPTYMRNLEQTLNHGLILERIHRVVKLNQKDWLKPYFVMNTKLRQKEKIPN